MPKDFEPLIQIQFNVLFHSRAKEAAPPTTTLAVGNRATNSATGAEEKETDVGIHL
jgi:hypothetical protein